MEVTAKHMDFLWFLNGWHFLKKTRQPIMTAWLTVRP